MTTAIAGAHREESAPKRSWQGTRFTADELIAAYEKGVEEGKDEWAEILAEKSTQNLFRAFEESEKLLEYISEDTPIEVADLYLCPDLPTHFCSLYLVAEEQYLSDEMLHIMQEARRRSMDLQGRTFILDFRFMPLTESTDLEAIQADGFHFHYVGNGEPEKTQARGA